MVAYLQNHSGGPKQVAEGLCVSDSFRGLLEPSLLEAVGPKTGREKEGRQES